MLTDDQIVALLSRNGSREQMLREAARMGALWALQRAEDVEGSGYEYEPGKWCYQPSVKEACDVARAAVGE